MTDDERAGIAWWNALTDERRRYWLTQARTAIVAEAWEYFKRCGGMGPQGPMQARGIESQSL